MSLTQYAMRQASGAALALAVVSLVPAAVNGWPPAADEPWTAWLLDRTNDASGNTAVHYGLGVQGQLPLSRAPERSNCPGLPFTLSPPAQEKDHDQATSAVPASNLAWLSESLPRCALARIGSLSWQAGGRQAIETLHYSPDDRLLASCGPDGTIKLWNPKAGTLIAVLWADPGVLQRIAFNRNSTMLASAGNVVRLWDLKTGRLRKTLERPPPEPRCIAFTESDEVVAAGKNQIVWWHGKSGKFVTRRTIPDEECLALSNDGKIAAAISFDRTDLRLWDTKSHKLLCTATARPLYVVHRPPVFSPNCGLLAVRSPKAIDLWNVPAVRKSPMLQLNHKTSRVVFSPDGKTIACAGPSSAVSLWDITTGKRLRQFNLEDYAGPIAFSSNGAFIASNDTACSIRTWETASGRSVSGPAPSPLSWPSRLAISPDGTEVLTVRGSEITFWHARSGKVLRKVALEAPTGAAPGLLSPDARLAAGLDKDKVYIWETASGKRTSVLTDHQQHGAWAFSADSKLLFSARSDFSIAVWDLSKRRIRCVLRGHSKRVGSLSASLDGRMLLSASDDKTARLWDLSSAAEIWCLTGNSAKVESAVLSPDCTTIATLHASGTLRLWRSGSGKQFASWPVSAVGPLWFLPGGKVLAHSCSSMIELWDAETGRPLPALLASRGSTDEAAVSLRSGYFVTASMYDKTALVWDTVQILERAVRPMALDATCWQYLWQGLGLESMQNEAIELIQAYPGQAARNIETMLDATRAQNGVLNDLIKNLAAPDADTRELAQQKIEALGPLAIPTLRETLPITSDAEARVRIKRILEPYTGALMDDQDRRLVNAKRVLRNLSEQPSIHAWVPMAKRLLRHPTFQARDSAR